MPEQYEKIRDHLIEEGTPEKEAKRIAAATYNKHHPDHPVTGHSDYNLDMPPEVYSVYQTHFTDAISHGHSEEDAHRRASRQIAHSGWYKSKEGWKKLHDDLRDKVNVREAVKQPDGHYMIEGIDVFYPNAVKEDKVFDAERIERAIKHTNMAIESGGQRPGLLEGHPAAHPIADALAKLSGKQERPFGYCVNWRTSEKGPGWVQCDLVDLDQTYIEGQRHRPLTGLSAGLAMDAGGLNERFDHVAALGSSMQALAFLPRTELFETNQVCFSFSPETFVGGEGVKSHQKETTHMLTKEHKEAIEAYSVASQAYISALRSYAAEEPESATKLAEAKKSMKETFEANKVYFSEEEELKHCPEHEAKDAPPEMHKEEEKEEDKDVKELTGKNEQYSALEEQNKTLQDQLYGAIGELHKMKFQADVKQIRSEGHQLPDDKSIEDMYSLCFSAEKPDESLKTLTSFLRSLPKASNFSALGTVLGAAGALPVESNKKDERTEEEYRKAYYRNVNLNFSADDAKKGAKLATKLGGLEEMLKDFVN